MCTSRFRRHRRGQRRHGTTVLRRTTRGNARRELIHQTRGHVATTTANTITASTTCAVAADTGDTPHAVVLCSGAKRGAFTDDISHIPPRERVRWTRRRHTYHWHHRTTNRGVHVAIDAILHVGAAGNRITIARWAISKLALWQLYFPLRHCLLRRTRGRRGIRIRTSLGGFELLEPVGIRRGSFRRCMIIVVIVFTVRHASGGLPSLVIL
mmetsp:Transcript_44286/g.77253  ORF Transcript_44286/g.77253 Transcript_44286/m.77253 type:complete len:211 (+) Transcript_44286:1258-1890(+)